MPLPVPLPSADCPPILRPALAVRRRPRASAAQPDAAAQAPAPEPVRWTSLADSYAPPPIPKPRLRVQPPAPQRPASTANGCAHPQTVAGTPEAADPAAIVPGPASADPKGAGLSLPLTPDGEAARPPGITRGGSYDRLADAQAAQPRPRRGLGGDDDDEEGVLRTSADVGDTGEVVSTGMGNISAIAASGGIGLGTAAMLSASGLGLFSPSGEGGVGGAPVNTPVSGLGPGTPAAPGVDDTGLIELSGPIEPAIVPEPASMLLLAIGLAALLVLRRKSGSRAEGRTSSALTS